MVLFLDDPNSKELLALSAQSPGAEAAHGTKMPSLLRAVMAVCTQYS